MEEKMTQQARIELAAQAKAHGAENPLEQLKLACLFHEHLPPRLEELVESLLLTSFYFGISEGLDRAAHAVKPKEAGHAEVPSVH